MSTPLLIQREDRVIRLTLNRPEARNRLDRALSGALAAALREADGDRRAGAVLIEAAGPVFCEGLDQDDPPEPEAELFRWESWPAKPVVAAVQGPCLAEGLGLLAGAHAVLAAQGVQFGLTGIRQGAFPFLVFDALARAIGERRTAELALTGRLFAAPEAKSIGLVHEVCPAFELEDRAAHTAHYLSALSPDVARRGLEFMRGLRGRAADAERENRASADFAEGLRALREGRPPRWPSLSGG